MEDGKEKNKQHSKIKRWMKCLEKKTGFLDHNLECLAGQWSLLADAEEEKKYSKHIPFFCRLCFGWLKKKSYVFRATNQHLYNHNSALITIH